MNRLAKELAQKIEDKVAKISVIGLGYVGLNISLAFAKADFDVLGFDIDENKIKKLMRGENYIKEEKALDNFLADFLNLNFHPSLVVEDASKVGDVVIIIVPTADDDVPTLNYLESALESVIANDIVGKLIVIESTVKVGTTDDFVKPYLEKTGLRAGDDFFLVYSPERIDPGNPEMTFNKIPKIVGGIDPQSSNLGTMLYQHVVEKVVQVSNTRTAEFVKLMENTQRDANIALMNLFAIMCEKAGIDIEETISAASTKWNFHRYRPSCGVGGHCLKKDPILLAQSFKESEIDLSLIYASRKINDLMPVLTSEKALWICKCLLNKKIEDVRIGILGLSYKKNSSDIRNSPAMFIIKYLEECGVKNIGIYDPIVNYMEGQEEISDLLRSDIIIHTVDHDGFKSILEKYDGYVIDGTNTLEPNEKVMGVGRLFSSFQDVNYEGYEKALQPIEKALTAMLKTQ
jgi:UDP-N-acetyl-D-glucosamine dehydrogenase